MEGNTHGHSPVKCLLRRTADIYSTTKHELPATRAVGEGNAIWWIADRNISAGGQSERGRSREEAHVPTCLTDIAVGRYLKQRFVRKVQQIGSREDASWCMLQGHVKLGPTDTCTLELVCATDALEYSHQAQQGGKRWKAACTAVKRSPSRRSSQERGSAAGVGKRKSRTHPIPMSPDLSHVVIVCRTVGDGRTSTSN